MTLLGGWAEHPTIQQNGIHLTVPSAGLVRGYTKPNPTEQNK